MKELWKVILDFPAYAVSNRGKVKRIVRGKRNHQCGVLKSWIGNHGYETVGLFDSGKTYKKLVHRLVCEAFHGKAPSEYHEVAHNDGSRTNHHADNLRWATRAENMADCIRHGTQINGSKHFTATNPEKIARGERHGCAVLSARDVIEIRKAKRYVGSGVILANKYGVSPATICVIRSRKIWKHLN